MELTIGQTLGDYEIIKVLGSGGMGKVYEVRNLISRRVEAMKVLLPDLTAERDLVERFLNEIRISASLDHPNIAALRTAQRVGNQLVMIMEFVEGSTLDQLMRASRIPVGKAVDYTSQALSALGYAHARGVVHRDIKPPNIMLMPNGTIKLMDFGIAKIATGSKLTKTGLMVGSVYYMSPEQIEGRELDGRTDIYSLGVTLYEIATGKRPFNGDSEYQIMAAHLKENPPPPREIDPSLPPALNEIILMALAKDPSQRFQSADAFRQALATLTPASAPASLAPKKDKRLLYMVAGSVATIAVIAAALIEIPKYWNAGASTAARTQAQSAPPPVVAASAQLVVQQQSAVQTPRQGQPRALPEPKTQLQPQPQAQVIPPVAQPVQTPPVQQPPAVAPNAAELSELRDRMMQISARTTSIEASLNKLQQEQAKQGLGLRGDMVAAQQRLNYQLNEADSNLKQGDHVNAKKRLDAAERELETIEKFLGR
ncbi:MAG: serine/threonine protein kinase [Bryobacterales bacterium]|nr:serine/threonine protein kinase [Bryobacterales bacterium]